MMVLITVADTCLILFFSGISKGVANKITFTTLLETKTVANIQNALLVFKIRFKCFKRVANIQNTLLMSYTRC